MLTPMDVHVKLGLAEHNKERKADPAEYQAIVGSLMYVALATRPDISFAVSALGRYNSSPLASHLTAAKRVLRFLKSTAHHRLHFSSEGNSEITPIGQTTAQTANRKAVMCSF